LGKFCVGKYNILSQIWHKNNIKNQKKAKFFKNFAKIRRKKSFFGE
jgi:hypothetical protein